MTDAEKTRLRLEGVQRLFRLKGDAFRDEVLKCHRDEICKGPDDTIRQRVQVEDHELLGRKWFRLYAFGKDPSKIRRKILFLHGGAYVLETGPQQPAFAAWLIEHTDVDIWFPAYHLAPEYTCLDALEMVISLYKSMIQETPASEIVFMGDSAGASLATSAAIFLKESGLPQPRHLILVSPVADATGPVTEEEKAWSAELQKNDQLLSVEACETMLDLWRGNLPRTDYRANPIDGDLHGLAPITMFSSTGDVLNLGSRRFWKKALEQGVEITYIERAKKPHSWGFTHPDAQKERQYMFGIIAEE